MKLPEGECPLCYEPVYEASFMAPGSTVAVPISLNVQPVEIYVEGAGGRLLRGSGYQRHSLTCEEKGVREAGAAQVVEEAGDDAERDPA